MSISDDEGSKSGVRTINKIFYSESTDLEN
jgi:hypothetical protein